jgi:hypothetical protein
MLTSRTAALAIAVALVSAAGATYAATRQADDRAVDPPSLLADVLCGGKGLESAVRLGTISRQRAAFISDASSVADWVETRYGPDGPRVPPEYNPWRTRQANEAVAVCYYVGSDFTAPRIPAVEPYDMLVLLVPENGPAVIDRFDHRDRKIGIIAPG